jgi:hypothetical protein
MNTAQQKKGRRTLLLIAAIFITPIVAALWLYFGNSSWRPATSNEHGELITPARPLPDTFLGPDNDTQLREVWSMVVLADQNCDEICQEALVHIRQIRLSLGPKMTRMQTIFLPASASAVTEDMAATHPVLIIGSPEQSAPVRDLINDYKNGEIFLVDPLGNLLMKYSADTEMGDIREDVGHLFLLSGIG